MKLLLVEDDLDSVEPLIDLIRENPSNEVIPARFEEANKKIESFRPDVVVLDRIDGNMTNRVDKGSETLRFILKKYWKKHFCPVIVYSALAEEKENEEDEYNKYSFIHYVNKGSGSDEKVMKKLAEIEPHIGILREVEEYVHETFSFVMTEVAPYVFEEYKDADERIDVMKRAARRRLAAQMDELSREESHKLAPWEQYLFPPINDKILLGDILKKRDCEDDNPSAFRIVLTPSCDLVNQKTEKVLFGQCCSIDEGLKQAFGVEKVNKKIKQKIKRFLSSGHSEGIIPLPELKGLIPPMAANLRKLELIAVDEIAAYERIASLDSPFREMVSWAYMQIAGRPGLPERDFDAWCKEVCAAL